MKPHAPKYDHVCLVCGGRWAGRTPRPNRCAYCDSVCWAGKPERKPRVAAPLKCTCGRRGCNICRSRWLMRVKRAAEAGRARTDVDLDTSALEWIERMDEKRQEAGL